MKHLNECCDIVEYRLEMKCEKKQTTKKWENYGIQKKVCMINVEFKKNFAV